MTQTQFISNQNVEKNGPWMIGAASHSSFHKMPLDSYMEDIFLLVIRGLFFCHATLRFMLAFHRFKGKGCCDSFCHMVKNHVGNSNIFVRQMFESECEVVDIDSIYVNYLNQITGPRLLDWTPAASTFEKGGCSFYKSGLQPDSWCLTDPFPETLVLDYTPVTLPTCMDKILSVYGSSGMRKIDKVVGTKYLRQMEDSTTTILYCLPRLYTQFLGTLEEPILQVCPCPRNSMNQLVAPIMRYQRKRMHELMTSIGPVSPTQFMKKIQQYCDDIDTIPFEITRLVLNKVCSFFESLFFNISLY